MHFYYSIVKSFFFFYVHPMLKYVCFNDARPLVRPLLKCDRMRVPIMQAALKSFANRETSAAGNEIPLNLMCSTRQRVTLLLIPSTALLLISCDNYTKCMRIGSKF